MIHAALEDDKAERCLDLKKPKFEKKFSVL